MKRHNILLAGLLLVAALAGLLLALGQGCDATLRGGGGVGCGDGTCADGETCATCAQDCGSCPPGCGNQSCDLDESCTNCPMDCGACSSDRGMGGDGGPLRDGARGDSSSPTPCAADPQYSLSGKSFQVGPTRTYKELSAVLGQLKAGDLVEVDGDATYQAVTISVGGSPGAPIVFRGVARNGKLPVLSGGTNTVKISASHVVLEQLEITGGSGTCVFHVADDITLRSSLVRDCPSHGILGADDGSGSLLLDRVEVRGCGGQPPSAALKHPVYVATDPTAYPSSVFRIQHSFIHDNNGGNSVKSRARRLEAYFNWIENDNKADSFYTIEAVGYDGQTSDPGQDADIVGNVLVSKNASGFRFGGDGTGASRGRVRFVHNTVIVGTGFSSSTTMIRFFGEDEGGAPGAIDAFEAINNLFYKAGGGEFRLTRDEAVWVSGAAKVAGRNNWIPTGTTDVPAGFTGTLTGAAPGLVSASSLTGLDVNPSGGAAISKAGSPDLTPGSGHAIASPLTSIGCMPPAQRPTSYRDMVRAVRPAESTPTIGARAP